MLLLKEVKDSNTMPMADETRRKARQNVYRWMSVLHAGNRNKEKS